jgi:hypothetical protein
MITAAQEQRAGPGDHGAVLDQAAVDQLDAPALALHRGLDLHRLHQRRAQQVNRETGGLQVRIDAGLLYAPTQQAADDLTTHRRAPRPPRHRARNIGVAIDSEECLGHDGGILDRHRYHDRTPD